MARFTDEAICIRHWDFSETSQTVSLFSREHGLIRGLAKGSKREKSRFCGGIELLTRGQITAIVKESRELATLTEWDLEEIFPVLARRLDAYYAAMYFAELVSSFLSESDAHPRLFAAMVRMLRGLDPERVAEPVTADAIAPRRILQFQWSVVCDTGFQPVLDRDAQTGESLVSAKDTFAHKTAGFSARAGGVVADTGEHDRWRVRRETIELLRALERAWSAGDGNGHDDAGPAHGGEPVRGIAWEVLVDAEDVAISRANRLIAAYIRSILEREPATMTKAVGEIGLR